MKNILINGYIYQNSLHIGEKPQSLQLLQSRSRKNQRLARRDLIRQFLEYSGWDTQYIKYLTLSELENIYKERGE